jgi:hypothetical protein
VFPDAVVAMNGDPGAMTEAACRRHESKRQSPWSGIMVPAWITFFVLLAWYPETLDTIWNWLRTLPLPAEIVMWIVMLPWAVGLAIWESSLATWLSVGLVVLLAFLWTSAFSGKH